MRIGIITFHRAYNCGAMFQAWALRKVLSDWGHDVSFPDNNPKGVEGRFSGYLTRRPGLARTLLRCCLSFLGSLIVVDLKRKRHRSFTVIFFESLNSIGRIIFARMHAHSSPWAWIKGVAIPAVITLAICLPLGFCVRFLLSESFLRVVVTTIVCELVLLPMLWFIILNEEERLFVREKVLSKFMKCIKK